MSNNLYRLIYTSSRRPKCTDEEIQKILASCHKNNPGKDITGVLLHSDRRFLQYLEGDKDEIMKLYEGIKKDERHGGVNLRYYSAINERIFPSWNMGYKDLESNASVYNMAMSKKDQETFKNLIENREESEEEGIRVLRMFYEMA